MYGPFYGEVLQLIIDRKWTACSKYLDAMTSWNNFHTRRRTQTSIQGQFLQTAAEAQPSTKSPGSGPSQARPSPTGALGLGPSDYQAQARSSQAGASLLLLPAETLAQLGADGRKDMVVHRSFGVPFTSGDAATMKGRGAGDTRRRN
jgi:hypothetical protein